MKEFFAKHRGVFIHLCYLIVIAVGYVIFNHSQSFLTIGVVCLWGLIIGLLYYIFLKDFEVKFPVLRKGLDLIISTFLLICCGMALSLVVDLTLYIFV